MRPGASRRTARRAVSPQEDSASPSGPIAWQAALLVPQPLLSLVYLAAVRGELLAPRFLPVVLAAAFPLASICAGVVAIRRGTPGHGRPIALLALAALELGWSAICAAIVGFAIGWRSG